VFGVTELLAALAGPVPVAFVAVTVNVYEVPIVKPLTVIGEAEPVPVSPPGLEVTVNPVIVAGYPAYAGAVKVTEAVVFPPVAVPIVGASGTVGQTLPPIACNCCLNVQTPFDVVVSGAVAEITPPV
jgi:hypothetical protein